MTDIRTPCQNDPETWFANGISSIQTAQRLCFGCPITAQCLLQALAHEGSSAKDMRHGVWGGTTPQERYNLYRQRMYAISTGRMVTDCPGGRRLRHLALGEEPCPRCAEQPAAAA